MSEAFTIIGTPRFGGILVVSDHASNRVPDDIDLGIEPDLLNQHIAVDIGVAEVGALMAEWPGIAAFQGGVSRLVCDFNRDEHLPTVVPVASDGHAIPGNALDHAAHEARLARFFRPYHDALGALLGDAPQALILSLHSFTPQLASSEEARPWHVGVLYNEDDRAARIAIPLLEAEGLCVGDQLPYSGKLLNATMNRHAEAEGR
ncbi:MAG: N-formylglutamate amidohydrolase, partial [Novosphingobium sp. 16-62-11]